nr:PREDICTED: uncharacterized protein LOC109038579 [Bemisia tabaci]
MKCLEEDIIEAGIQERRIALGKGNIGKDGVPYVTVIADGGWSHRSYGHKYTAKSGCAIIIGKETKKILYFGVRNKYCSVCAIAQGKKVAIPEHNCYKNWDGTSPAMEADIIVEGFNKSEEMHKITYMYLIADGDSSVHKSVIERVSYGHEVQKLECVNHLMKNVSKRIYEFQATLKDDTEKKFLTNKRIKWYTKYARGLLEELSKNKEPQTEVVAVITNMSNHFLGNHRDCRARYCRKAGTEEKTEFPPSFLVPLANILSSLTNHTTSIIENETTNLAELYMHLLTVFTGAKAVFYGRRSGFILRSSAACLLFQHSHSWRSRLYRHMYQRDPPKWLQDFEAKRARKLLEQARKREENSQRRSFVQYFWDNDINSDGEASSQPRQNLGADYGIHSQQPDLPPATLERKVQEHLRLLQVDEDERNAIEKETVGQSTGPNKTKWEGRRKYRTTASWFGAICLLTGFPGDQVYRMLNSKDIDTDATRWGKTKEKVVRQEFERMTGLQVDECGLFVYIPKGYLAASPDGLIHAEKATIEIKCPYRFRFTTISKALTSKPKPQFYASVVDGQLKLNELHPYMFQIQGQLAITSRDKCYFIVWTPQELLYQVIDFDLSMWNEMLPILVDYHTNHMVLEIVDSRKSRNMPIRHSKNDPGAKKVEWGEKFKKKKQIVKAQAASVSHDHPFEILRRPRITELPASKTAHDHSYIKRLTVSRQKKSNERLQASPQQIPHTMVHLRSANHESSLQLEIGNIQLMNTCGFDSLATIVANAIRDYEFYATLAAQANNPLLEFSSLMVNGESKERLRECRAKILIEHEIGRRDGDFFCCESFMENVCFLLASTPSAEQVRSCTREECLAVRNLLLPCIKLPDENLLDLPQLQRVLTDWTMERFDECPHCKQELALTSTKLGHHLFILTDKLQDGFMQVIAPTRDTTFKISNLQEEIQISDERFVLAGVVEFLGEIDTTDIGHFRAYVRRKSGQWELHDDRYMGPKANPVINRNINPQLIAYIRLQDK